MILSNGPDEIAEVRDKTESQNREPVSANSYQFFHRFNQLRPVISAPSFLLKVSRIAGCQPVVESSSSPARLQS